MEIKTYTITDDNHVVSKTLGTATTYSNCVFHEPADVTAPVVRVQTTSNLSDVNYCYIARYGRYYFVTKVVAAANGLWELHCKVDVLMSYKSQIKALTGTFERSETMYNGYLNDPKYKALAYRKIVTKQFPNAMDNDCFILMTVG